ncbi:histidine kinase [Saccharopolyspora gloriosae]|uniref:histidine kinase n=1 Tax=Saccharopolyspora gloriosae TaxID=455344 RepID=A0A840NK58_9PSEU|nr:histidine kinase [Saccharopolyspora gloriosae]MBB5071954.1 signal transduction histidine kinase [Saccharopolyspora gloriosae]
MIKVRRVRAWWHRQPVVARDFPLALLLIVASLLPMFRGQETQVGNLPGRPFDAVAAVALALECWPLAWRRRWPGASLALVVLGFLIAEVGSYHMVAGTALTFSLISAGVHLDHHRRTACVVLTATYLGLVAVLVRLGAPEPPSGYVLFYVLAVIAWSIGAWVRSTRALEAERRHRVAVETRAAERARIARELHDVVTHHVTAMVVQAEAARYLTAAPERLDQTLTTVTDTGRSAITDLRHLLDVLHPDHDAGSPHVGKIRALVEQTRRAGQPVEFTEEGEAATGSADVVAYRVVQESLTNALKHARGSRTSVRVRHGAGEIAVQVSTDGSGALPGNPGGSGRGLAGLRDRVDVLGGDFSAGASAGGGFVVQARIPGGAAS